MQTLLLPACRSGISAPPAINAVASPHHHLHRLSRCPSPLSFSSCLTSSSFLTSPNLFDTRHRSSLSSSPSFSSYGHLDRRKSVSSVVAMASPASISPTENLEKAKLAQVSKRLEGTSRYFKRLGNLGFWGQLVSTVVAAVILSFSAVVTGKVSSPATFYATAGGIVAAFISVFWSFGYIQLAERLRRSANDPSKAPSRADVVTTLKNGIIVNLLGMGATVLGMQATVGLLVAKALSSSANPYQGISSGYNPVIALDVFLVQASANTILSHFLGLVFSLELLRSVVVVPTEGIPVPAAA